MKSKEFTITDDVYATQGQRFLNFIIDLIFIYIIILSIGTTIKLVSDATNNFAISTWVKTMSKKEIVFYCMMITFLYYFLTETYFSRTIAKLITKTVVIKKDGSKPSTKMFLIRALSRFIPFEPFSYLKVLPRGWHDTLSDTYVVKKKRLANKMKLFYSFDEIAKI
ncbi:MAG TPA: RDD family protein [Flavobacterium sp.]|uniref:RDD family protein n=1 Tax=Flavobacterium sp. TaxID=239 RepID=UPI002F3E6F38